MTYKKWLGTAFDLLGQPLADGVIVERLVAAGCPAQTANKLVAFVPTACGRMLLGRLGVAFPDTYRGMLDDGSIGPPQRFDADRDWMPTRNFLIRQHMGSPAAVHRIGMRSAEFDAINQAIANGARPADLVCADLIFAFVAPAEKPRRFRSLLSFWRRGRAA